MGHQRPDDVRGDLNARPPSSSSSPTPPVISNTVTAAPEGTNPNPSPPRSIKPALKLLALLSVVALLLVGLHGTSLGNSFHNSLYNSLTRPDFLAVRVNAANQFARLYFVILSAGLIMVGTPRVFFYTLGGYTFGFWEGLTWSLCGSLAGSFIAFRFARWGGRDWLLGRFEKHRFFERILNAQPTILSVALIRLLPVSNLLINGGLALSQTGSRAFLLGSLVGFLPQGILFVLIGTGLSVPGHWSDAIPIGAVGVVFAAALYWFSKQRKA